MKLNKSALKRRLTAEGRWEEFVRAREEFKTESMPTADAWVAAAEQFPPLTDDELATIPDRIDATGKPVKLEQFEGRSSTVDDDVRWAYRHLHVEDVSPEMAPGSGAWCMVLWASRNPANEIAFFRALLTRVLPMAPPTPSPGGGQQSGTIDSQVVAGSH